MVLYFLQEVMLRHVACFDAYQLERKQSVQELCGDELHEVVRHRDVAQAEVPYACAKLPLHRLTNIPHDLVLQGAEGVAAVDSDVNVIEAVEYLDQVLRLTTDAVDDDLAYGGDRLSRQVIEEGDVLRNVSCMLPVDQVFDEVQGAVAADGRSEALVGLLRLPVPLVRSAEHLLLDEQLLEHVFQQRVLSVWRRHQMLYCILYWYPGLCTYTDELAVRENPILALLRYPLYGVAK